MNQIKDPVKALVLPFLGLVVVGGLVVLFGGVKMLSLSGRGLAMTASILAMIPCFSGLVCVIGIPIGIWSIIVLGNPDVRAAYLAVVPDERHAAAGKEAGLTAHVERFWCTVRQRCGRFVRKTPSFSKCQWNHVGSLWDFIRHYNASLL